MAMSEFELPEERIARKPAMRRLKFWGGALLAALAVSGISVSWLVDRRSPSTESGTAVDRGSSETGWGPEREVYTIATPAPIAVFNSIIDNPNFGDERNFVGVKYSSVETAGSWVDELAVSPGQHLLMRVYYENSAADNFVTSAPSWLQHARVSIWTSPQPDYRIGLWAQLSASNAADIWDGATLISNVPVRLVPVPGSGKLEDNAHAGNPLVLDLTQLLSTEGAPIGDGDERVLPGYQYARYVTVEFEVVSI